MGGRGVPARERSLSGSPWRADEGGWAPQPLGAVAAWRQAALARLREIGGDGAGVVASMVFGDRGAIAGTAAEEDARTAGVAWALVASGLHLGVAVLLAERVAGMLGCTRRGRAVAALCALAVFALACGLRVSLMRAALVATTAALARLLGRRRDGTAAVGIAVLVLVIVDPPAASDVGLLLGVLAVTAISVFGGLGVAVDRSADRTAPRRGAGVLLRRATRCRAGRRRPCSAPWALLGPFALAVSVPAVQAAVMTGCAGALVLPMWAAGGTAALRAAAVAASAALAVWRTVARPSGSRRCRRRRAVVGVGCVGGRVPGGCGCGGRAHAGRRARGRSRWSEPRLLAVLVLVPMPLRPGITVLDVGQGDAILVRDGGHALLVDTGPDAGGRCAGRSRERGSAASTGSCSRTRTRTISAAWRAWRGSRGRDGSVSPTWTMPRIDALARDCARRANAVVRLRRDMTWQVGETRVRVLWPSGGERRLDANDTSVVLLLERGRRAGAAARGRGGAGPARRAARVRRPRRRAEGRPPRQSERQRARGPRRVVAAARAHQRGRGQPVRASVAHRARLAR